SPAASVPLSLPIPRALSFARADLLPSPKTTRSPELATDLEVSLAESSEPSRYRGTDLEMDVDVERSDGLILTSRFRFIVEAIDLEEIETGARGPVEVRVNRVTHPVIVDDIPKPTQEEGAVEVTYNTLGDLVKRFHDHTEEIPVHRVQAIKRALGARDAARNLEPLIGDGSEKEEVNGNGENRNRGNENGGNENGGNGNGGNGNGRNRNGGNGNGGNGNGGNRNGGNGNGGGNGYNFEGFMPARERTYQDFLKCQPLSFNGTEGVAGLTHWFEKMETVFYISNCPEKYQVKYATCTLLNSALTWWNSHKRTIRIEAAYAMSWAELMKMVPNEEDKVKRFVGGLPDNIQGNVIAAEPTKL
ncbi:hypothetical protein Tco_1269294, partial [Tanacetum coccineum]